jgi:hypothetical protein
MYGRNLRKLKVIIRYNKPLRNLGFFILMKIHDIYMSVLANIIIFVIKGALGTCYFLRFKYKYLRSAAVIKTMK